MIQRVFQIERACFCQAAFFEIHSVYCLRVLAVLGGIPENIVSSCFCSPVVSVRPCSNVSLVRVHGKREHAGGYSRGNMDEDLAAIFKRTRRHRLESLSLSFFSIQRATKEHLAYELRKTAAIVTGRVLLEIAKRLHGEKRDTIFSLLRSCSLTLDVASSVSLLALFAFCSPRDDSLDSSLDSLYYETDDCCNLTQLSIRVCTLMSNCICTF